MADHPAPSDGEADAAPEAPPPGTRKKLIMIIAAAALLLLVAAAGAAAWLLGKKPAPQRVATDSEAVETYIDVPPLIVNLRSADGAARLIKLHLMLVPATADKGAMLTARMPLIIDRFQPFLRELRPEDLAGSAAVFRIKEELLIRANGVAGAGAIKEILIQDLVQQ